MTRNTLTSGTQTPSWRPSLFLLFLSATIGLTAAAEAKPKHGPKMKAAPTQTESVCGDGYSHPDEECDAGSLNGDEGAGCTLTCELPECGDGHRASGEYCDDGNLVDGDGCSSECKTEHERKMTKYDENWVYEVYVQSEEEGADDAYELATQYTVSSDHFTIRWDDELLDAIRENGDDPNDYFSDENLEESLESLEKIWDLYIEEYGMEAPYANADTKYKTELQVIEGGAFGGGKWGLPILWVGYDGLTGSALDHEFGHAWQYSTGGLQSNSYVGFMWETHSRLLTFLNDYGTEEQDDNCSKYVAMHPHIHPGSSRLNYCSWPYLEYMRQEFGMDRVSEMWTEAPTDEESGAQAVTTPFTALQDNMEWDLDVLNDFFGLYAMNNVNWDYEQHDLFAEEFAAFDYRGHDSLNHLAQLAAVNGEQRQYVIPDFLAPQRWGYNISEIVPEAGASSVMVRFKGIVQDDASTTDFGTYYENEPHIGLHDNDEYLGWETAVPTPDSGWRWGVVAIQADGTSRKSALQSGSESSMNFPVLSDDQRIFLVVSAAPNTHEHLFFDQAYRSIYRYPWMVEYRGGYAKGFEPGACDFPAGIEGEAHSNGGGFVADTASVASTAFVGHCARVLDNAIVTGNVRILNRAIVSGDAAVSGSAIIREDALVTDEAVVDGNALIEDMAIIQGGWITDDAAVGGVTRIDSAVVADSATWYNAFMTHDFGVTLDGTAQVFGDGVTYQDDLGQGVYSGAVFSFNYFYPTLGFERTEVPAEVTWTLRPELGETLGWDGIVYADDADDDNDGILDSEDAFPNDASEWGDIDEDGIGDNEDTDDNNDGIIDIDNDGDGLGNEVDEDDDNDGTLDIFDLDVDGDFLNNWHDHFPEDSTEVSDLDFDGIGDNADTDDNNDGVVDTDEDCGEGPTWCVTDDQFKEMGFFRGYWDEVNGELLEGDHIVLDGEIHELRRDAAASTDKFDDDGNMLAWIGLHDWDLDGSTRGNSNNIALGAKFYRIEEPAETYCQYSGEEICDGIDNDCDGEIDEGFENTDGDEFGYILDGEDASYDSLQIWGGADCVDEDDDNDGVLDLVDEDPLDADLDGYDSNGDGVAGDPVETKLTWDLETLIAIGDEIKVDMLTAFDDPVRFQTQARRYSVYIHRASDAALAYWVNVNVNYYTGVEEVVIDLEPGEYTLTVTSLRIEKGFIWGFVDAEPFTVVAED